MVFLMRPSLLPVAAMLVSIITLTRAIPMWVPPAAENNVTNHEVSSLNTTSCSKYKCHKATAVGGKGECCSGCCIDYGPKFRPERTCGDKGMCPSVCSKEQESCQDRNDCCTKNTFTPPGCCKKGIAGPDCSECKGGQYAFVHNCVKNKCLKCAGESESCDAPGGCCAGKICCGGPSNNNKCGLPDGAGLGSSGGPTPNNICPDGKNTRCCSGLCYEKSYSDPLSYWACGKGPAPPPPK